MKKRGPGRPTRLNSELAEKICGLLSEGVSITATCDALAIAESRYFEWLKKDAKFREQATHARANGKIALVRQILADKDWRAKAWYLERCWPNEFGRSVDRPLPLPAEPQPVADLCAIFPMKLSLPDGRTIDAAEALRAFTSFPRRCSECGSHQRRDHEHEKHECDEPQPEQPMRHRFDRISGQIVPYDNGESLED
jgi:hypothetical protein